MKRSSINQLFRIVLVAIIPMVSYAGCGDAYNCETTYISRYFNICHVRYYDESDRLQTEIVSFFSDERATVYPEYYIFADGKHQTVISSSCNSNDKSEEVTTCEYVPNVNLTVREYDDHYVVSGVTDKNHDLVNVTWTLNGNQRQSGKNTRYTYRRNYSSRPKSLNVNITATATDDNGNMCTGTIQTQFHDVYCGMGTNIGCP